MDYFNIFIYLLTGTFLVLIRLVQLPFKVITDIWRLDRSIVPGRLEHVDPAYSSYIGMVIMDHTYNNPIVNVFVHIVCADMMKRTELIKSTLGLSKNDSLSLSLSSLSSSSSSPSIDGGDIDPKKRKRYEIVKKERRSKQIQFKWWLYTILALNKPLRGCRRHAIVNEKEKIEEREKAIMKLIETQDAEGRELRYLKSLDDPLSPTPAPSQYGAKRSVERERESDREREREMEKERRTNSEVELPVFDEEKGNSEPGPSISSIPSMPSSLTSRSKEREKENERESERERDSERERERERDEVQDGVDVGGGWKRYIDENQYPYYYHAETNTTTWDEPNVE